MQAPSRIAASNEFPLTSIHAGGLATGLAKQGLPRLFWRILWCVGSIAQVHVGLQAWNIYEKSDRKLMGNTVTSVLLFANNLRQTSFTRFKMGGRGQVLGRTDRSSRGMKMKELHIYFIADQSVRFVAAVSWWKALLYAAQTWPENWWWVCKINS